MKFIQTESREEAKKQAPPSAEKIVKVDGGYMAFETISEYENWKNQK